MTIVWQIFAHHSDSPLSRIFYLRSTRTHSELHFQFAHHSDTCSEAREFLAHHSSTRSEARDRLAHHSDTGSEARDGINDSLRMYKSDEIKMYTLNQKNMIIILR